MAWFGILQHRLIIVDAGVCLFQVALDLLCLPTVLLLYVRTVEHSGVDWDGFG